MKRILTFSFLFALLGITCFGQASFDKQLRKPRKENRSSVQIVGCYSDSRLIEDGGLVVGNGSLTIKKVNSRYVGTFSELASDSGRSHPEVKIKNLIVNELKGTVIFYLPLYSGGILKVKGQISRNGLKLNWGRKIATEYGQPSPFMQRKKCKL